MFYFFFWRHNTNVLYGWQGWWCATKRRNQTETTITRAGITLTVTTSSQTIAMLTECCGLLSHNYIESNSAENRHRHQTFDYMSNKSNVHSITNTKLTETTRGGQQETSMSRVCIYSSHAKAPASNCMLVSERMFLLLRKAPSWILCIFLPMPMVLVRIVRHCAFLHLWECAISYRDEKLHGTTMMMMILQMYFAEFVIQQHMKRIRWVPQEVVWCVEAKHISRVSIILTHSSRYFFFMLYSDLLFFSPLSVFSPNVSRRIVLAEKETDWKLLVKANDVKF